MSDDLPEPLVDAIRTALWNQLLGAIPPAHITTCAEMAAAAALNSDGIVTGVSFDNLLETISMVRDERNALQARVRELTEALEAAVDEVDRWCDGDLWPTESMDRLLMRARAVLRQGAEP